MKLLDHDFNLQPLQEGYADFVNRWAGSDQDHHKDGRFHFSGLGQCVRKAVLKRHGYAGRPSTPEKDAMFAEANFIHAGMTTYWMKQGLAVGREFRLQDGPFPGWSGKPDALLHFPECCGNNAERRAEVAEAIKAVIYAESVGLMPDVDNWADAHRILPVIRDHQFVCFSVKTVAPAGLKNYIDKPGEHHVWQDSGYAWNMKRRWGLTKLPIICIGYRSRGGSASTIFHMVEPYPVDEKIAEYDQAWFRWLEDQTLPDVLPLAVKTRKDPRHGQVVNLEIPWECGYCDYCNWHNGDGNFRCLGAQTKNQTGDRVGVISDGSVLLKPEWFSKYGYSQEQVVAAVNRAQQEDNAFVNITIG